MNNPENNKWLDKALSETIGSEKLRPDFEQWKKKYPNAVENIKSQAHSKPIPKCAIDIRAIIMKSPITKFAAAAVFAAAIFLGGHIFLGGGTAITVAEIVEQIKKVTWMHGVIEETEYEIDAPTQVEQQYNSESWTCLNPYRDITVTSVGDIRYDGYSSDKYVSAQYEPATNKILIKYLKKDDNHNSLPDDPLRLFLMQLENMEKQGAKVTYTKKDYEGVLAWYIDFEFTYEDNIHANGTLIVNLETSLPIKFSTNTGDANNDSIRRTMSVLIDYPDTGPTDIYLAGMPKDAIIENTEDSIPTEFTQAINEFHNAKKNLPEKYALVSIFAENDNIIRDVFLVYKNKEMKRLEHYENRKKDGLPQGVSDLDSLVKWINESNFMSHNTKIQDGEYEYAAYPGANGEWSITKGKLGSILYIDLNGQKNIGDLPDLGWPMIVVGWPITPIGSFPGHNYRIIQNDYSQKNNLLCYERLNQSVIRNGQVYSISSKNLFYVDPQRDYMCVRSEYYKQDIIIRPGTTTINIDELGIDPENIPTEPSSIIEVTEFGTTSAGQWYPKKLRKSMRTQYEESNGQSYSQQEEQTVFVYFDTNPVFPEGVFDTNNLP